MLFKTNMKNVLAARGYRHCRHDEEFVLHGEYARNIQYAFSREFAGPHERIVDIIFLAADVLNEKLVVGFLRENVLVEHGVILNTNVSIPFSRLSPGEFERQLDRLIPPEPSLQSGIGLHGRF